MQGIAITTDLFALPLGELDAVLGVQWLQGLGKIITNYGQGTMQLKKDDKMVTLRSGTDDHVREIGIKTIDRLLKKGEKCYGIRIEPIFSNSDFTHDIKNYDDIAKILHDYSAVLD